MPTSTNVTNLKINELTEAQYDTAVQGGVIGANEISILTDAEAGQVIQVATLPTASADELGNIYQFIGTTDANYTNGYFYECVSDGQATPTYSWTQKAVQPSSGGLPSQTGNAGKFLTTDGTAASWSDKPLVNTATGTNSINIIGSSMSGNYNVGIGKSNYVANGDYCVAVGYSAQAMASIGGTAIGANTSSGGYGVALGRYARAGAYAAQINISMNSHTNNDANTFKVGNANGNFEIMSADGTIPTDRFTTTPVADGTYVPTLTISSGVASRSWSAPGGGGSTAATGTLVAADWSSSSQTINVTGVTASNNVIVAPAPASQAAYTAAGIICTGQSTNSLTFSCNTTPSSDIVVTVLIV